MPTPVQCSRPTIDVVTNGIRVRSRRGAACLVLLMVAACASDDSPSVGRGSLPPQDGTFDKQWSARLGGEVVNVVTADSEIYVAVERDKALEVAAVDLVDGAFRWTATLADSGSWAVEWNLATTSAGVMTSYVDDAGNGHLVLLDRSSGSEVWDTRLEDSAYELWGEVADGIGGLMTGEESAAFVDLQTGALSTNVEPEGIDGVVDGQLVVQDGSTLRVGIDPFDLSAKVTEIQLSSIAPVHAWTKTDKLLVLGAVDGTVSAFVDGEPRWSIDVDLPDVKDLRAVGDHVLGVISSSESPDGYRSEYFWFDERGASPLGGVPAGFEHADGGLLGDTAVVVGSIGPAGVLLAFDQSGTTELGTFDGAGAEPTDILGQYIALGDGAEFRILALDGLNEVARVQKPPPRPFMTHSLFRIGDDYLVTADADEVTLYR